MPDCFPNMTVNQDSRGNSGTPALLLRFRVVLGLFILGLIASGITAFPLQRELEMLVSLRGIPAEATAASYSGLDAWILTIRDGLRTVYAAYPWMAYGTDWLAFAHIVIAVFFIGAMVHPVRNVWVLWAGLIACALVLPLALICGPIRGIPFAWRLIDCSFGIGGAIPLLYCLSLARKMARAEGAHAS
jgi:hypothetical protein